jgi:hypothetical protein
MSDVQVPSAVAALSAGSTEHHRGGSPVGRGGRQRERDSPPCTSFPIDHQRAAPQRGPRLAPPHTGCRLCGQHGYYARVFLAQQDASGVSISGGWWIW